MTKLQEICEDVVFGEIEEGQQFIRTVCGECSLAQITSKKKKTLNFDIFSPDLKFSAYNYVKSFIGKPPHTFEYTPIQHPTFKNTKVGDKIIALKDFYSPATPENKRQTKGKVYTVLKNSHGALIVIGDDGYELRVHENEFSIIRK